MKASLTIYFPAEFERPAPGRLAWPRGGFPLCGRRRQARENPDQLVITLSHELHHAFRQQKDWPVSTWFYAVSDEARGEEEVQAYVIGESISRRITGRIRTVNSVQETLDKSYHLGPGAKKSARAMLTGAWMSLDENLVPPMEVAIYAHELLDNLGVPPL